MSPYINYLGVIFAAIVGVLLGFLWYGPLFGKTWIKLMGFTKESVEKDKKKGMGKTYAIMTLATLLMAYVLAHTTEFSMNYTKIYGMSGGLISGLSMWAGFIVPVKISDQLWGSKSWKLFFLDAGYYLVSLTLMGIIVATWR